MFVTVFYIAFSNLLQSIGVEGTGLAPWAGGPLGASFGFYLREAFQSQNHTKKILYNESL